MSRIFRKETAFHRLGKFRPSLLWRFASCARFGRDGFRGLPPTPQPCAAWMQANGEAIYETRPWKVYGEGPNSIKAGSFRGGSVSKLGEKDIRFTRNKSGTVIYTLVLGWPTESFTVQALGLSAATRPGR